MEKAIIYKKLSCRPLSKYQLAMNSAAQEICTARPGMLLGKRHDLIQAARSKIISDGFQFVKGKSRSKLDGDDCPSTPKRKKSNVDLRRKRVHDLQEDFKDLNDRIGFKEQRRTAAQNIKDYKKCEDITEEISSLRRNRREIEMELTQLETKNRKSKWYFQKKISASGASDEEDTGGCFSKRRKSSHNTPSSVNSRSSTPMPLSSSPSEPPTPTFDSSSDAIPRRHQRFLSDSSDEVVILDEEHRSSQTHDDMTRQESGTCYYVTIL